MKRTYAMTPGERTVYRLTIAASALLVLVVLVAVT